MKYKFFIIKKTINAIIKDGKKHKAINFYVNSLNYLKKKRKIKNITFTYKYYSNGKTYFTYYTFKTRK